MMSSGDTHPLGRKRRVLLILEPPEVHQSAAATLSEAGYAVQSRNSPIGATVEIARSGIDVVVIDVDIDVMSGDRFAALIRKNDRLDHVGLVLVSSEPPQEVARVAQAVGADAGINKNVIDRALLGAVEIALDRSGGVGLSREPPPADTDTVLMLKGERFALPLAEGRQLIGRDPDCRFVLNDPSVSRQHAAIDVHGIRARIEDLSRHGTVVNGEKIDRYRDLDIGDIIEIGDETLVLAVKTQLVRETTQVDEEEM